MNCDSACRLPLPNCCETDRIIAICHSILPYRVDMAAVRVQSCNDGFNPYLGLNSLYFVLNLLDKSGAKLVFASQ